MFEFRVKYGLNHPLVTFIYHWVMHLTKKFSPAVGFVYILARFFFTTNVAHLDHLHITLAYMTDAKNM